MESNNPAYLLATLDQLRSYITITTPTFDPDGYFQCLLTRRTGSSKIPGAPIKFKADALAKKLPYDWEQLQNRVNVYQKLTDIPLSADLTESACFYYCHSLILDSIGWANFTSGNLSYRIQGTPYRLSKEYLLDSKTAVGSAAILYGLSINEYMGSHYSVVTPNKKEHYIRGGANHCSCSRYSAATNGFCEHSALGMVYANNRALLVSAGLASFM
jgi:hypothetical protein